MKLHFLYEIQELINSKSFLMIVRNGALSYRLPQKSSIPDPDAVIDHLSQLSMNMAIEHALMHARILYEFYYRPNQNPYNYARAMMFVKDFPIPQFTENIKEETIINNEGKSIENENGFWFKVNNQVSHMGWERFEEPEKKFNYYETICIINDLLEITKKFLDKLPEAYYFGDLKVIRDILDKVISQNKFRQSMD